MVVRGTEFWGIELIVSLCAVYAVVLAVALLVAGVRRMLREADDAGVKARATGSVRSPG